MALKLSFDEDKWLLKCYWKVENVDEVQRSWRVEFGTPPPPPPPPTRVTIRIRDKFEALLLIFKSHSIRDGLDEEEVQGSSRVDLSI